MYLINYLLVSKKLNLSRVSCAVRQAFFFINEDGMIHYSYVLLQHHPFIQHVLQSVFGLVGLLDEKVNRVGKVINFADEAE